MAPRRSAALAAAAAAALALLAGCASPEQPVPAVTGDDPDRPIGGPTEAAGDPAPTPEDWWTAPPRSEPIPAACGDADAAFGFGVVDAAAGSRYLVVTVANCGDAPLALTSPPTIRLADAAGEPVAVAVEHSGGADPEPATVEPGGEAYLHLRWASNGRCERGASRLEIALGDGSGRLEDCLQLGPGQDEPDEAEHTLRWRWSTSRSIS